MDHDENVDYQRLWRATQAGDQEMARVAWYWHNEPTVDARPQYEARLRAFARVCLRQWSAMNAAGHEFAEMALDRLEVEAG